MIINQWYVAEETANIGETPTHVTLLGFDYVLFRGAGGEIHCLSDVCIHRGASLSAGLMQGSCVECPYHGWQFDGTGSVVKIPSLPEDSKIPTRARVDSYPVQEKYGWVWVFLGDLPAAERPPLPDFPEYDDTAQWRTVRGEFAWKADYARIVENGLDFAHAPFVHPSFGDRDNAVIHDFELQQDEWSATAKVTYIPPLPKGLWKFLRRERSAVQAQPGYHVSGATMRLDVWLSATHHMVIFDVNTPVDEVTTLTRWIMARSFLRQRLWDKDSARRTLKIFEQDAKIVEEICPETVPSDLREELTVPSDGLMNAFRAKRRELIDRGWQIDIDKLRSEVNGRRAVVIPSPRRRAEEGKNYVFKTVPLVPAKGQS
jgi:phenylpropionate dioxygenase-like ring-hydroxylating dioxygenase large terminal subunit